MKKLFLVSTLVLAAVIAVAAYVFIPTHVRLSTEILNKSVGDGFKLVGHKVISTEPKDSKLNHYFLIAEDTDVPDAEPFLITSDPFIKAVETSETANKLKIELKGRIKAFDNDLWVKKSDGTVHHWLLSIDAQYEK